MDLAVEQEMRVFSEETRRRMSEAAKRRCQTPAWREQTGGYFQPFCTAEELRRDYVDGGMSQTEIAARYGVTLKRVQTAMRRFQIQPRRQVKRDQRGERNHMWKGDQATYTAYHNRIASLHGQPQKCEVCGTSDSKKTYDWANLSGRYADPSDYRRMCRSCHWKHDQTIRNLGGYAKPPGKEV
jgi:hypothetical protein